jgi:hypothetical protein
MEKTWKKEIRPQIALLLKIFAGWYIAFGLAAFFPRTNEPFFTKPLKDWDSLHCSLLAFAGLYTLQCAIWTLISAYYFPYRIVAVSMVVQLALVVSVAAWLQLTTNTFSTIGLSAFAIDGFFGLMFAYLSIS